MNRKPRGGKIKKLRLDHLAFDATYENNLSEIEARYRLDLIRTIVDVNLVVTRTMVTAQPSSESGACSM